MIRKMSPRRNLRLRPKDDPLRAGGRLFERIGSPRSGLRYLCDLADEDHRAARGVDGPHRRAGALDGDDDFVLRLVPPAESTTRPPRATGAPPPSRHQHRVLRLRPRLRVIERIVQPAALVRAGARSSRSGRRIAADCAVRSGRWLRGSGRNNRRPRRRSRSIRCCGALEPLGGADDADIVPHEAADLGPVLLDDHFFVGIGDAAFVPRADRRRRRRIRPNGREYRFAAASPNTKHSSSELEARRLAP